MKPEELEKENGKREVSVEEKEGAIVEIWQKGVRHTKVIGDAGKEDRVEWIGVNSAPE